MRKIPTKKTKDYKTQIAINVLILKECNWAVPKIKL